MKSYHARYSTQVHRALRLRPNFDDFNVAAKEIGHMHSVKRKKTGLINPVLSQFIDFRSVGRVVQHRHGATVLRPAAVVVTNGDRSFLAVGNRLDA